MLMELQVFFVMLKFDIHTHIYVEINCDLFGNTRHDRRCYCTLLLLYLVLFMFSLSLLYCSHAVSFHK